MPRILNRYYGGSVQLGSVSSSARAATIASSSLSPGSGSFTIRLWYKAVSFATVTKALARYTGATYNIDGWMISQYNQNAFIYAKSGPPVVTVTDIFDTGWHLYCFVFDASDHSISSYRDGVFIVKSSINAWSGSFNASESLYIGGYLGGATGANITDVIYDVGTAWTATQVSDDYFHNIQPSTITHRWKFDEGAGATATALVGGLNMTLTLPAAFSADSPMRSKTLSSHYGGSILNYNNINSVFIADSVSFQSITNQLSIECWVKPHTIKLQDYNAIVIKTTSAAWTDGWGLYWDQHGSLKFFINHYITGGTYTGNGKLKNNEWQHIIATYDGSLLKIYINGVLSNTPVAYSSSLVQLSSGVRFGMGPGTQYHPSNIASVRIYSRALSNDDILNRYLYNKDDVAMRLNLISETNFMDTASTTCADRSGNSNNATLFTTGMITTESPKFVNGAIINVIPYSENVSLSPWNNDAVSVANYPTSIPSDLTSIQTITDTDVSTVHRLRLGPLPVITGSRYVISCYAKKISGSNVWLALGPNGGAIASYYNLSTGTVGSSGGGIGTTNVIARNIELVDNDYYRISMAFRADSVLANAIVLNIYMASADGTVTYANGGTANVYAVGGVQLEIAGPDQTTPSKYVATVANPLSTFNTKITSNRSVMSNRSLI